MTQYSTTQKDCFVHITEGEMAPGVFQSLREGYHLGAAWEEVRDEFIKQAIDQLRAQRLAITGESVGTWLAGQSHFFLPEEIDAVIVAPLWGRQ